jgi:hypothetical protein
MSRVESELDLLVLGHRALRIPGTELAALLGVTPKTVYRWYGKRTSVGANKLGELAPHVHPHDPALAERIHEYAARTLAQYRLQPPPPLPTSPAPEPTAHTASVAPRTLHVESVVHAVCEALDAGPRAVRPAVLAAFRRARELALSVDDVLQELAPAVSGEAAARASRGRSPRPPRRSTTRSARGSSR